MDAISVAFVSAATALVSAVVGPVVSFLVAQRQIRANVISNNRERWIESLRDSIAEYVGLFITAGIIKQALTQAQGDALRGDTDLRKVAERVVHLRNRILLMCSPDDPLYSALCAPLDASYALLVGDVAPTIETVRSLADTITKAGRDVLRAEWGRVKRGE